MTQYTLYQIRIVRDIPMMYLITSGSFMNIIEAEDNFQMSMSGGSQYLILRG